MAEEHSSFIKTPRQLVVTVVLAFAIPIALITIVTQLITTQRTGVSDDERRVLERIQPVGTVVLAAPSGPKGALTGEQVFAQVCKTCHEAGIAGAPKAGDKAAWGPRVAEGEATLVQHAIAGFQGKSGVMPPKGGNGDLTDDEVQRAVVYMANQVGAGWKEKPIAVTATASTAAATTAPPAQPAASGAMVAAATPANVPAAAPAASTDASAGKGVVDGKSVFQGTCSVCHGAGIAGAPKVGDKAAWGPRIAEGTPTLYQHALNGFTGKSGTMPPKGGNLSLDDAQVKAAVDYMVGQAK